MNPIEDRLRDAFRADAETIAPETIRPATIRPATRQPEKAQPVLVRRGRPAGRRLRPRRVVIPLSAGAAVAAIAVAATLTGTVSGGRGAVTAGHPAAAVPAPAHNIAQGYPGDRLPAAPAPRFFVGIWQPRNSGNDDGTEIAVYSSATGRIIAKIKDPARGQYFRSVAALGSDQQFVAAATPAGQSAKDCHTWLYQFRLTSRGMPVSISTLAVRKVPDQTVADEMAASANGKLISYEKERCGPGRFIGQELINLSTGKERAVPAGQYRGNSPSLSATGSLLGSIGVKNNDFGGSVPDQGAWVASTGSPTIPARQVVTHDVLAAALSPTGRLTFALTARRTRAGFNERIGAYDTSSGKLIRRLYAVRLPGLIADPVMKTDVSGRYLLVADTYLGNVQIVDAATGHLHTVPVSNANEPLDLAW